MTQLLEKALKKVGALSDEEQNAIASQILETLEDEEVWQRKLSSHPKKLRRLAKEALEEHRRGESHPLDEIL